MKFMKNIYQGFEMDKSRLGINLEKILEFQHALAKDVCADLDARFVNNDLNSCFKIINFF